MNAPGTKQIVDVLQSFVESRLFDIHTSLPGKIISFNATSGCAMVQPLVRLKRRIGEEIFTLEVPPIENVPVITFSSSSFRFKFSLKKGDQCAIFFSETGLGNFLNSTGDIVDTEDLARFSLTDAFCIPGLWGLKNAPSGTITIDVSVDGKVQLLDGTSVFEKDKVTLLGGTASFTKGEALESLLNTFFNALAAITPGDVTANAAALTAIKTAAGVAAGNTSTIKSTKIKGE